MTRGTSKKDCWQSYDTFEPYYDDRTEEVVWERRGPETLDPESRPHVASDQLLYKKGEILEPNGDPNIEAGSEANGRLVRIYIRTLDTADQLLKVHYINDITGHEFHHYNIKPQAGQVFDPEFALVDGQLIHNTVTNVNGNTRTVPTDLAMLKDIDPLYLKSDFQCVRAERSEDGTEVFLYYTFGYDVHVVADFGLDIDLTDAIINGISDAHNGLGDTGLVSVEVKDTRYGTVKVTQENDGVSQVVYSMKDPDTQQYETLPGTDRVILEVTWQGTMVPQDQGTVEVFVYVHPASNILYEENFLYPMENSAWTLSEGPALGNQSADNTAPYGYDDAYRTSTGTCGTWDATVTSTGESRISGSMQFAFNGTGFDLITSCGPATGMYVVRLCNADGQLMRAFIVDTTLNDPELGTIHQVPIIHVQDLPELADGWKYQMTIQGLYIDPPEAGTMSAMDGMPAVDPGELYEVLYEMGFTDDEIDEIEFVNADHISSVSAFSADPEPVTQQEAYPESMTLQVDGIRVYRPADDPFYTDTEKDMTYTNVVSRALEGKLMAYIAPDGTALEGGYTAQEYQENGGPENEIYLGPGQAVAFKVADPSARAQISARSVTGKPVRVT